MALLLLAVCVPQAMAGRVVLGGYDVVEYFSLQKDANGTMGSKNHGFTLKTEDLSQNPPTSTGVFSRLISPHHPPPTTHHIISSLNMLASKANTIFGSKMTPTELHLLPILGNTPRNTVVSDPMG